MALKSQGVIEPLKKRNENSDARSVLAYNLKTARSALTGLPSMYTYVGSHYTRKKRGMVDFKDLDDFYSHVQKRLKQARPNRKIRWLDIGPGIAEYFMPFFEQIDPTGQKIELHSLQPSQILPKKITGNTSKTLHLSGWPIQFYKRVKNFNYNRWKDRLASHVGAIETYDSSKLGKFNLIVSYLGGVNYSSPHDLLTVVKVASMLKRKGTAFLQLYDFSEKQINQVKTQLGSSFKLLHREIPENDDRLIVIHRN